MAVLLKNLNKANFDENVYTLFLAKYVILH